MKEFYCSRAQKPCRTKQDAEKRAFEHEDYRRAYKCEFCDFWHITSREPREAANWVEPLERDTD